MYFYSGWISVDLGECQVLIVLRSEHFDGWKLHTWYCISNYFYYSSSIMVQYYRMIIQFFCFNLAHLQAHLFELYSEIFSALSKFENLFWVFFLFSIRCLFFLSIFMSSEVTIRSMTYDVTECSHSILHFVYLLLCVYI